jgi:hypothetical protein
MHFQAQSAVHCTLRNIILKSLIIYPLDLDKTGIRLYYLYI